MNEENEEKEGYWTPLEKRWRDYLFWPLTWSVKKIPYAANSLTVIGFLILFWAMMDFLYYKQPLNRQIGFLIAAWLTDLFDGPIARNNKNVTAFGTAADHTRDYCLGFWMIFLSFNVTAQLKESLPTTINMIYAILFLTLAGLMGIIYGNWVFAKEKRLERADQPYALFLQEFLLKDLNTTLTARIHTFILALGYILYLIGANELNFFYLQMGVILLIAQLLILGFYLHELLWQKYEDNTYKLRLKMQNKIKILEEALKKMREKTE